MARFNKFVKVLEEIGWEEITDFLSARNGGWYRESLYLVFLTPEEYTEVKKSVERISTGWCERHCDPQRLGTSAYIVGYQNTGDDEDHLRVFPVEGADWPRDLRKSLYLPLLKFLRQYNRRRK